MQLLVQTATPATAAAAHDFGFYAFLSTLYGIVEGLTEFLPVSSTAHLRLVEAWSGIDMGSGYWKMYSVVIQLGAILSVPLLFWDRIVKLCRTFSNNNPTAAGGAAPAELEYARPGIGPRPWYTHPLSLVMIGFLVTAGPCYLADKYIGKNLESTLVIALSLLIGGVVMWVVDALFTRPKVNKMEEMGVLDAIWIGAVQILSAVFPGTSRSMSTIAAGQVFGLSRATALEYSFFLSIPTMFAATGYKLLQALIKRPKTAEAIAEYNAPPHQWGILLIGFVVSFIVAWLVNRWFINWVKSRGFAPFAIYRILLGAGLLVWMAMGGGR